MINRDELQVVSAVLGVDAQVGSLIPQNMVRFIYRIKFVNQAVGPNLLTLGKRENGAGVTTNIDSLQAVVTGEMITDPDELKEDAVPLYKVYGRTGNVAAVPNSGVWAAGSAGAASGIITLWYLDKEA